MPLNVWTVGRVCCAGADVHRIWKDYRLKPHRKGTVHPKINKTLHAYQGKNILKIISVSMSKTGLVNKRVSSAISLVGNDDKLKSSLMQDENTQTRPSQIAMAWLLCVELMAEWWNSSEE
jgi:hypothetical protein